MNKLGFGLTHLIVIMLLTFTVGGFIGYGAGETHQKTDDVSYYNDKLSEQKLQDDKECSGAVSYVYNLCLGLIEDNCSPDTKVDPKTLPPILPQPSSNDLGL